MRRASALLLFVIFASGCAKSGSTTTAPDTTPTRILSLEGDLNFGTVNIGQAKNAGFTIANEGNSPLTIDGFSGPCAASGVFAFSWRSGTIEPGAAQPVIVTFSPRPPPTSCSGSVRVRGDQTSGEDTIPMTAVGAFLGPPGR
jgi:hypothetical protein